MLDQKNLYLQNRRLVHALLPLDEAVAVGEQRWIGTCLADLTPHGTVEELDGWNASFRSLIENEKAHVPESARYVSEAMPLDEFRTLVGEFAVDGLTEAQAFYYVLPRLPLEAQMPMLRIMIDEFGSGNLRRAHSTLYRNLLRELGMPLELNFYINRTADSSFAFVNLFYWLTMRADDPSYFAGAITYLETAIPYLFSCYADACRRLEIRSHTYYTEHQHIDAFHAREGLRLLRTMAGAAALDSSKAWLGVRLAQAITAQAFERAVIKASETDNSTITEGAPT